MRISLLVCLVTILGFGAFPGLASTSRVTDAHLQGNPKLRRAGLGQSVQVTVSDLAALKAEADEAGKSLVLYIDDVEFKELTLMPFNPDLNTLVFKLARNEEDRVSWNYLLGAPKDFEKVVEISVGLKGKFPIPTDVDDFQLIVIGRFRALFTLVLIGVLAFCLFRLARDTEILRDNCPRVGDHRRPFSLARTQMAFWFLLTMVSMMVIWAITGGLDGPTPQVLTLIGIGSGTALGAAMMEAGKGTGANSSLEKQLEQYNREMTSVDAGLAEMEKTAPADADARKEHDTQKAEMVEKKQELQQKIDEIQSPEYQYVSDGFWRDILTDMRGVSFHRFQMVVFTLFLGMVFLIDVYQNLAMPEFDATLLSLMGISSGTYLGFKFPES